MSFTQHPQLELGKKSEYQSIYNPDLLFPIQRESKRLEIGVDPKALPFHGWDLWNHYEVSWLNPKGKPMVAMAHITYDCHSPCLIESKSLKLYFNSFNNTTVDSIEALTAMVKNDLSHCVGVDVHVKILPLSSLKPNLFCTFEGESIDDLDVACDVYEVAPEFLTTSSEVVSETLHSDLLKSNCLVTYQPDWGSVLIQYQGPKIQREGLLKYLVSFRNHNEFHEQCIERIFVDIMNHCKPQQLTVYGRYTRRGGLDINPVRSTHSISLPDASFRLIRQ